MHLFLKRSLKFIVGIPIMLLCAYFTLDYALNNLKDLDKAIVVFGDSQAYQGVDLDLISTSTGKKVYTAARHGAGVYDFLVFANKIPPHTEVVVALSKPLQLRRKNFDRNRAGFTLNALLALWNHNYTVAEIYQILKKNWMPSELLLSESHLYPQLDSVLLSPPVSVFEEIYHQTPGYLHDKQSLFLKGIKILKDKGCSINLIEFPYHPLLEAIERDAEVSHQTETFKKSVAAEFEQFSTDTIYINPENNLMYDLTHLNEAGAAIVSEQLAKKWDDSVKPTLYVISWRKN